MYEWINKWEKINRDDRYEYISINCNNDKIINWIQTKLQDSALQFDIKELPCVLFINKETVGSFFY